MNDIEIWKQCPEFTWIEVNPLGNVRTVDRFVQVGRGGTRFIKGNILKQHCDKDGYLKVAFKVNGKSVHRGVHRLVAQTYLPNPDNFPQVNHKDCDRTNNNVDNLEWCDALYNNQYRNKYGVSYKEAAQKLPVLAVNLNTLEISRFRSQHEASRVLGADNSNINKVIKGKLNHTHGYWFTNADINAIEAARTKFGDVVNDKVEDLMTDKELQLA